MNQLKIGVILNYIVIILNMLVGILYTPYMLRMMGQSEYGLYSLVASVISYLTVLDLGMGNAIIRYTAKYRAEGKTTEQYEMFGMFFILYVIIGIISLFAGLGLLFNVDSIFGTAMTAEELDKARTMILFLIFNLAITFPLSIFGSIITAYEHFAFPKLVNIARVILNTLIMVCLLKMGYKAVAMVIIQTCFNVVSLILNYLYCKYKLHIKLFFNKFDWSFLKEVGIYSFWIFLNVIMDKIYWSTGQFVLGAVASTAAVAVYAVAIQLHGMYNMFSTAIASVFLPKVTGMVTRNDNKKEISEMFIRTGRIQYIVMAFILSGFIVFGRQFIILWAGPDYEDAYLMTLLFFISLLPPLIQNLGITILQARNQMKFRSLLYIVIAIISLFIQIILANKYGGLGCAIAVSGALLLGQGVIMNIYYHNKQSLDTLSFWFEILKMSIVPIILCAISIYLIRNTVLDNWFSLGMAISAFTFVYIPLFFYISLNQYERDMFIKPIKKVIKRKNCRHLHSEAH